MYKYLGNTNIHLYDFLSTFSFVVLLVFNLTQLNKKKLLLGKASVSLLQSIKKRNHNSNAEVILVLIEIFIISIFQYAFAATINIAFGNLVKTGGNYFGLLFFMPFLIAFSCFLLGVDVLKQIDLITPAYPLALVFSKLACFCAGCCNGIECSYGLYNYSTKAVEIPVQLVESGLALFLFLFLMFWKKRAKEGTMFSTYLIIYSATRFFSEFLRSEPAVIWNLKTYQLLCLAGIAVGIIELFIVKNYSDRIKTFYNTSFDFFAVFLYKFALKIGLIRKKDIVHHKKRKKK